ncbi:MAG: serine/threonine kinase, partial [Moheibacter sp.]
IVGKSKRLAFTQLKIAGLVVGDTIYEPDIAKDAVLRVLFQGKQIAADAQLPRFAKVDLVLGKGLEYGVSTPALVGMTLDQAESSILANRFEVGRITYQGAVTDSLKLKVFYQYPLQGDNYDQGLPVDLWVSEMEPENLRNLVKDLDRQYRNYSDNDSIAAAKYAEQLRLEEKSGSEIDKTPPPPSTKPTEKPEGIQIE